MGYCPYFCVCCGIIVDNGWGSSDMQYHQRVAIITNIIGEENCKYLNYRVYDYKYYQINDLHHPATEDVCDNCFIKIKPDSFFKKEHTKKERREFWKNHCKKTQYT